MAGTVKYKKNSDEKIIFDNNKKSDEHKTDWDGAQEDEADDEGSNKDHDQVFLNKKTPFIDQPRDWKIYEGPNSGSLSSLTRHHLVNFSSTGSRDDVSPELSTQKKRKLTLYDWLVLLMSFLSVMICTGIIGSMSVFYVEFLDEFSNSKAEVALVPSMANGMYDIGAFGSSVVMLTGMVRVGQQFGHEHPIGTVIISGSHPAGFIFFPLIMPMLIRLYTWRGTILILSGITLNIIPLGLLATYGMKKEKMEVKAEEPAEGSWGKRCLRKCPLDMELLKNPKFQFFALTSAFNWSSTFLVHLLIVDFAEDRGFTLSQGATLLTMVGLSALLSRAMAGALKMIKGVKSITWYIFFSLISSVIHTCIPMTKSYMSLLSTVLIIGVMFGCRFSFFVLALLDMVPLKKYSQALGYCLSLWGVGVMMTGPIVGELSSINGSYDFCYITGGLVGAVSLLPLTVYLIRNKGDFSLRTYNTDST